MECDPAIEVGVLADPRIYISNPNSEEDDVDRALIRVAFYRSVLTPSQASDRVWLITLKKHEKMAKDPLWIPNPGSRRIFGYFHDVLMLLLMKKQCVKKPPAKEFSARKCYNVSPDAANFVQR